MQNQIAVVGGCNIDISATSYTFLIEADSNPGYVKTTLGGVGRNIAENLLLLGYPVSMITPLSRDSFLSQILSHSVEIGLDLSHSVYFDDVPNSVYLAVSCMEICEKLTPDVISTQMDFLNSCPYVVLDANLRADTLAYIAEHCHAALCADAVSVKKAERLRPILHRLTFLKVNRAEAEILVGFPVNDFDSVSKASALLHAQGIPIVAITMGSGGAFLSNGDEACVLPPMAHDGVNYSGCGDAFFAGVLHGLINRKSTSATLRCGLAMSALSASSPCAVSPDVSAEALEQILSETKEEK